MATSPARSKARSASPKPAAKQTRKAPVVKKSDAKPPETEPTPEPTPEQPPPGPQQSGVVVVVRYNDNTATIIGVGEVGDTRPSEVPYLLEKAIDVWKAAQNRGGGGG